MRIKCLIFLNWTTKKHCLQTQAQDTLYSVVNQIQYRSLKFNI